MNKYVCYKMRSDDPDPRNSGDTKSWFRFYKWRAGSTWVPAKEGCLDAEKNDQLWFSIDGVWIGAVVITDVVEHNLQGERELHFDSDELFIPTDPYPDDTYPTDAVLIQYRDGEEPTWLKRLLIEKQS
jgi:hypothetical protein